MEVEVAPVDFGGVLDTEPQASVQDQVHFTYDDHQAATATRAPSGNQDTGGAFMFASG